MSSGSIQWQCVRVHRVRFGVEKMVGMSVCNRRHHNIGMIISRSVVPFVSLGSPAHLGRPNWIRPVQNGWLSVMAHIFMYYILTSTLIRAQSIELVGVRALWLKPQAFRLSQKVHILMNALRTSCTLYDRLTFQVCEDDVRHKQMFDISWAFRGLILMPR